MDELQLGRLMQKLDGIERDVNDLRRKLDEDYVTQDQYKPVSQIVYAMVALILVGFMGAVVALVYGHAK